MPTTGRAKSERDQPYFRVKGWNRRFATLKEAEAFREAVGHPERPILECTISGKLRRVL